MSDEMTSGQRLRAALLGQPVDRIPFSPFLAYVWEHYPQEMQKRGQRKFLNEIGADPMWRGSCCPVKASTKDCIWKREENGDLAVTTITTPVGNLRMTQQHSPKGNTWFLIEHPLKTREDFKIQTWIEENTRQEYGPEPVHQHLAGDGADGLSLGMLVPRCKSAFQSLVEHHVGTEELAYAMADFPDAVEQLIAAMVERDLEAARLAAQAPYEFWITWEDSSTQNYSPAQYQGYIAAEIRQWCDILRPHGKHYLQHACGHVKHLLPAMVAQGNLGVESISPAPTGNIEIGEARNIVGESFAIIGGLEPLHLLNLSGTQFDGYVEETLQAGGKRAFVLANSDSCPPGVSPEKFARVCSIVRAWRR